MNNLSFGSSLVSILSFCLKRGEQGKGFLDKWNFSNIEGGYHGNGLIKHLQNTFLQPQRGISGSGDMGEHENIGCGWLYPMLRYASKYHPVAAALWASFILSVHSYNSFHNLFFSILSFHTQHSFFYSNTYLKHTEKKLNT